MPPYVPKEHSPQWGASSGSLNDRNNPNQIHFLLRSAILPRPHDCLPVAAVGRGGTRSVLIYETGSDDFFKIFTVKPPELCLFFPRRVTGACRAPLWRQRPGKPHRERNGFPLPKRWGGLAALHRDKGSHPRLPGVIMLDYRPTGNRIFLQCMTSRIFRPEWFYPGRIRSCSVSRAHRTQQPLQRRAYSIGQKKALR